MHILDLLLDVPSMDADDARQRRLINVFLACVLAFALLGVVLATIPASAGWRPEPLSARSSGASIVVMLVGAVVVYVVNRYWSGRVAGFLLLVSVLAAVFVSGPREAISGQSRIGFAVPIVLASALIRPSASLVVAGLVVALVVGVGYGVLSIEVDVPAMLTFVSLALLSWIVAHNLEHLLSGLDRANQELDRRIVERTEQLERRSVQLRTASEVARDATAILDSSRLLDETAGLIRDRFGFEYVGVFLLDEGGERAILRAVASEGERDMPVVGDERRVGGSEIVGCVAGLGEARIALQVGEDASRFAYPDLPEAHFDEVALPLISRGSVIGVLDVWARRETVITKEDVSTLQTMADQLANAIERARLLRAEQRRRNEAETLYRATKALATTLELPRVFEAILSELQKVVPYDSASVQLLRDGRLEIIGGRGFPNLDELLGVSFDVSSQDNPNGQVVLRREPVILDDAPASYAGFRSGPHDAIGVRGWLGVPLVLGDRVTGMLALDKREPGFYTPEHARLVSAFAAQAAIAIENARLFEEATRHVEQLSVLHSIDVSITSSLDLDQVLQTIYEQVRDIVSTATFFYIALYHQKRDEIEARLIVDQGKVLPSFVSTVGEGSGLAGWVVRNQEPVWVEDMETERDALPAEVMAVGTPTRSLMVLPLIVRDQVVGVISAQSPEPHAFDEYHRQLFSGIANQAAIAVENARLFEEVSRRLAESRVIQEVTLATASTLDVDRVLEYAIKSLYRALGIDRLGFLVADESKEMLAPHPSLVGPGAQDVFQVPIEGSPYGQAYRTGQPVLVEDVRRHNAYSAPLADVRSVLAVPVRIGGRIAAVLYAESSRVKAFGEDEFRLFSTIAGHLGVTLENARLYREVHETSQLRTELVQNVSHELRTPLGLIRGYIELLLGGDLGEIPESQHTALRVIRDRTATLSRLIHNLTMLQVIPPEALILLPVSVVDILQHVVAEFERTARLAGIEFEDELPQELPLVIGDEERLGLVFGHLLDNAIKFSPDGGKVTIRGWAENGEVKASITDEGIGIGAQHLQRIFERFYQVDGTPKRRYGGMGIGLALVWEIVTAHGGTVDVESEPGQGSTFTVALPQAQDEKASL